MTRYRSCRCTMHVQDTAVVDIHIPVKAAYLDVDV